MNDAGFTLIELLMAIVIMGIITVPLGNFFIEYLKNYGTTTQRMSDSHDIQVATAYFSQDVADVGMHDTDGTDAADPYKFVQSSWTKDYPATYAYCGKSVGTPLLLLEWDSWTVNQNAASSTYSASWRPLGIAYVVEGTSLHRLYCTAPVSAAHTIGDFTTVSDVSVVDNLQSASVTCTAPSGVTTTDPCNFTTPPATISLALNISGGSRDSAAPEAPVTLDGERRQT